MHQRLQAVGIFYPCLERLRKKLVSGISVYVLRWKDGPDILSVYALLHTHRFLLWEREAG